MNTRSLALAFTALISTSVWLLPTAANADTILSRARVQNLRNKVDLLTQQQAARSAKKDDAMSPGDALRTYRAAMAELRFNDQSLARIGEQAFFRFIPNSRTFDLRNGTVLLLIPPKQGITRVRTPNAAAGIRGSALFVRYLEDTKVTLVGALTNSNIEVSNQDGTQTYTLKAGEMAYIYQDRIGIYNFDLKTFQETSPLFKEVDWSNLQAVRTEVDDALKTQGPLAGKSEPTPVWVKMAGNREVAASPSIGGRDLRKPDLVEPAFLASPVDRLDTNSIPRSSPGLPLQPPGSTIALPSLPTAGTIVQPVGSTASIQQPSIQQPPSSAPASLPTRPEPTPITPQIQLITPPTAVVTPPTAPITPPTAAAAPPPTITPPATSVVPTPVVTPPTSPVVSSPPVAQPVTPVTPSTPSAPSVTPNLDLPAVTVQPSRPAPAPLPTTTLTTTTTVTTPVGGTSVQTQIGVGASGTPSTP